MYACRVIQDRNRFLLRPTFGTLSSFWLLLAIPICCLLLGTAIWLQLDAVRGVEIPAFALPLFLSLSVGMLVCFLLVAGNAPFPLILDREKGLKLNRRWVPVESMTSLRMEHDEEDELNEHFHLYLHLSSGQRLELKRSLWPLESNHDRACHVAHELSAFLDVPFIDSTLRTELVPVAFLRS